MNRNPESIGIVRSVNASAVRMMPIDGASVATGILKVPVNGRVVVSGVNLAGDEQGDRSVHGGPDRAIYAYAAEDYAWWSDRVGRALAPGTFGENLTLEGIDVTGATIGERWRIGSTTVQVTSIRVPCFKLAAVMGDRGFVKDFAQALRPGAYLRILEEGDVAAGDSAAILSRPSHDLTIGEMARLYFFDRSNAGKMLAAPELPESWRTWASEHER
jgi:MOSC domain-containing protein YiiM